MFAHSIAAMAVTLLLITLVSSHHMLMAQALSLPGSSTQTNNCFPSIGRSSTGQLPESKSLVSSPRILSPISLPTHRRSSQLYSSFGSNTSTNNKNFFDFGTIFGNNNKIQNNQQSKEIESAIALSQRFIDFYNSGNVNAILPLFTEDIIWDDFNYDYKPMMGIVNVERRLRLQSDIPNAATNVVVEEIIVNSNGVGMKIHNEDTNRRGLIYLTLNDDATKDDDKKIRQIEWISESEYKAGEMSLKILSVVSQLTRSSSSIKPQEMERNNLNVERVRIDSSLSAPEQYFDAWNQRDMTQALTCFTEDVTYDDTAFPEPFQGQEKLKDHLLKCAECFPKTFTFRVDDTLMDRKGGRPEKLMMMMKWHVEDNGQRQPFTRGVSFYKIDAKNGKIKDGIDFVEPVLKKGPITLFFQSVQSKLQQEPVRYIPLFVWILYLYIVFVSDGILPGANALQLEQRTWEEVRDLSLNFFLVAPLLQLPFSPTVHPMLEGVFNVLLAWAAMFAGFLSDDRPTKPNIVPMVPIVIGMQFLTSAFLLPYLVTRTSEQEKNLPVTKQQLSKVGQLCESKLFSPALGLVGSYSIVWAFIGRYDDFGDVSQRWTSFLELLSIDRVGSSFVVDLLIFALFQGWFVDDDLRRRGVDDLTNNNNDSIRWIRFAGKFIPFFGMAAYLALRPPLPENP